MTGTYERSPTTSLSAAISNAVVHLLAEYTGRGPTKARTHLSDDFVAVVLQDTFTRGERSLVRDGKTDLVLSTRKAYQQTMRTDLVAAIEQLTGRTVRAFFSDNHVDPDIAVECFVLAPQDGTGPSALN